jgi:hypothetical protein
MLTVTVICTDPGCWEEREIFVESFDELDEGACGCGWGFVVTRVAETTAERR